MMVRNEGGEPWEFMVLLHTYLRVAVGSSLFAAEQTGGELGKDKAN